MSPERPVTHHSGSHTDWLDETGVISGVIPGVMRTSCDHSRLVLVLGGVPAGACVHLVWVEGICPTAGSPRRLRWTGLDVSP
jgi:hypothetical protein